MAEKKQKATRQSRKPKETNSEPVEGRALITADTAKAWHANPLLLKARFPKDLEDPQALAQFTGVCLHTNLNPILGEIVPIHGRAYITEEGWLRLIDERAPGQLLDYRLELATKDEKDGFGIKAAGWLGKATVRRLLPPVKGLPPGRNERIITDYFFFSGTAMENSFIDAVQEEPWRHAMKTAGVRALRKAFRDVVSGAVGDRDVSDSANSEDIEAEYERLAALPAEDPEATERRRFWARANEIGIKNGSPELAQLLGLPESGVGAMKEHYLDKGGTWFDANVALDKLESGEIRLVDKLDDLPEGQRVTQCYVCGNVMKEPMVDPGTGVYLVCSEKCAEGVETRMKEREARKRKDSTFHGKRPSRSRAKKQ